MPTAPVVGAGGVARSATGGGACHPKPRRRATRVTFLSLRRSTINVENVGVRLWQSSAICLRANARSAFLFTGSPRSFHSLAMTKGTKWIIPQSLTTPSRWDTPPTEGNLARPVAKQLPFTTNGAADFHTVAEQSSPLRRGAAKRRGGLSRVTSNKYPHHCHCEGARNVETVVVRLWQSSAICLRAFARSAFLFTGSPRSFHSLAMTKGTKWIIPQSLTTPSRWDTPPTEGNLARPVAKQLPFTTNGAADFHTVAEQSSPLRRGGARQRAGVVYHPKPWRRMKHKSRVTSNPTPRHRTR